MNDGLFIVLAFFQGSFFDKDHFLEESLGGSYRRKVVGCLSLVQSKGVGQQIHACFHIVVYRITDLLPLAA